MRAMLAPYNHTGHFSVHSFATEDQPLPFPVLVTLTSNPEGIEDYPKGAELNAEMKAIVDVDGKFKAYKMTVNYACELSGEGCLQTKRGLTIS